jgi:serine protease Do
MTHEEQIVLAVKKVMPAVVSITASREMTVIQASEPLGTKSPDLTPEMMGDEAPLGGGSGFIVDKSGIILTNKHVIIDPRLSYTIITADDRTFPVKVVARDAIHDIAILKVDTTEHTTFPAIDMATADHLELGQTVIAIGNALGEFQNTVSTGVISGLSRLISAVTDISGHQERLRGLIQTDAAINPGNSGGPLINLQGKAIGINAAIVFGAQNIGFAIPIKKAIRDLADVKQFGHIRRPFLGIRYILLNKKIAARFGLPMENGALILKEAIPGDHAVIPDSPAYKSGLREGDIVLAANGKEITEKLSLEDMLETCNIGDTLHLDYLRSGHEKHSATVELVERS